MEQQGSVASMRAYRAHVAGAASLFATVLAVASCGSGNTGSPTAGGPQTSGAADGGVDAAASADGTLADTAVADALTSPDRLATPDGSDAAVSADSGASPIGSDGAPSADSGASGEAGPDASGGDASAFGDAGACLDGGYLGCAIVLASGQNQPLDVAVDSLSVYWCNAGTYGSSDGSIMKVPVGGGLPVTLASGLDTPQFIAIDATSVYWTAGDGDGRVMSVPIAGGTPVMIGTSTYPQDLAVDGTYVYWADQVDGAIYRAPLGGGTRVTFAPAVSPIGVAIDSTHLYWTNADLSANAPAGTVTSRPLDGGAMTTLATGQDTPEEIVVDGVHAFWRDLGIAGGPSGIAMAPLDGGDVTFLRENNGSLYLALDTRNLYFATPSQVLASPVPLTLDGGNTPAALASLQQDPAGLALDSTSLYWAVDGNIVKLTPR